ncbi:MAG: hypothetical protein FJ278_01765 [Planctomycetes bacterium]|nr:hypothetical protein [Planctomycetota bacterium]
MKVRILTDNGRAIVTAPYHPSFPPAAKARGGRWSSQLRAWVFDLRDEKDIRVVLHRIFGTDGTTCAALVTVQHRLTATEAYRAELWLFGRLVAKRPGRDAEVRLGEKVVIAEGEFPPSAESAKYPQLGTTNVVLEVRDVPCTLVPAGDPNTWIVSP